MSWSSSQDCSGTRSPRRLCLSSRVEIAVLSFLGAGAGFTFVLLSPVPPAPSNYTVFNGCLLNEGIHACMNECLAQAP